ncbi:MAG: T9SS C-terminal target domain-containing protein [Bacteroidetes bacterium]|nr:MAG: T9SS C-terminal target domain-containing protein [Bacteroidota bacterium]
MKKILAILILLLTSINSILLAQSTSIGAGNCLSFSGTNQYAQIPNNAATNFGTADFTIEFWVKTSQTTAAHLLGNRDSLTISGSWYKISMSNLGNIVFETGNDNNTGNSFSMFTGQPINDGKWHHVAVNRLSSTNTANIYIDGILAVTSNTTNANNVTANSNPIVIGINFGNTGQFGYIDELRFWNSARTESEIRNDMCQKITVFPTNLVAYYIFNQVSGSAIDTINSNHAFLFNGLEYAPSGAPIGDISVNDYNFGTTQLDLTDGNGTFSANNFSLNIDQGIHLYKVRERPNNLNLTDAKALDSVNYFGLFGVNLSENPKVFYDYSNDSILSDLISEQSILLNRINAEAHSWSFSVNKTFVDQSNQSIISLNNLNSEFLIGENLSKTLPKQLPSSGRSLSFAASSLVSIPFSQETSFSDKLTVEFWIKPKQKDQIWITHNTSDRPFVFAIDNSNKIKVTLNNSTTLTSSSSIIFNQWTHVAFVYDQENALATLYLNGKEETSNPFTDNLFYNNSGIYIGGDPNDASKNFTGEIDELRFWNTHRSLDLIRANMCQKLTGKENNLAAYYRFDEKGTEVFDWANGNKITSANALNLVFSGAPIGNKSTYFYGNNNGGTIVEATLTHDDGDSFNFIADDSDNFVHLYLVNEAPENVVPPANSPDSSMVLLADNRYFGVFYSDSTLKYNITYNYAGNSELEGNTSESFLAFAKRRNNADTVWNFAGGDLDVPNNSISYESHKSKEYIIGFTTINNVSFKSFTLNNNIIPEKKFVGYTIGQFVVTTDQVNQSFTLELLNSNGLYYEQYFTLQGSNLITKAVFDYDVFTDSITNESIPIPIKVRVKDKDGKTFDRIFQLYVGVGQPFEPQNNKLTDIASGQVIWLDYDQDGLLDVLLSGQNNQGFANTLLYKNKNGTPENIEFMAALKGAISNFSNSNIAVTDLNNDNFVDFALTGNDHLGNAVSEIYFYDSEKKAFFPIQNNLVPLTNSSVTTLDYDRDGDQDIVISGQDQAKNPRTILYRNLTKGQFEETNIALTALHSGTIKTADINSDGYQDLILNGLNSSKNVQTVMYLNNQSNDFVLQNSNIIGLYKGDFAFADLDQNGFADLVITGSDGQNDHAKIYLNQKGIFTEKNTSSDEPDLQAISKSSVALIDYDSDGWIDVAISGAAADSSVTLIYKNYDGKEFVSLSEMLPLRNSSLAFGDMNNDKRPDLIASGLYEDQDNDGNETTPITQVFANTINDYNDKPSKPSNIKVRIQNQNISLSWNPASDHETKSKSLTYNVFIKNENGAFLVSPLANLQTGRRYVVQEGNAQYDTSFVLKNVPYGRYTWGVQTVDGSFETSEFANSEELSVSNRQIVICPDIENLKLNSAIIQKNCLTNEKKVSVKLSVNILSGLDSAQIKFFWYKEGKKGDIQSLTMPKKYKKGTSTRIDTTILFDPNSKYFFYAQAQNSCLKKVISADSSFQTPVIFGKNIIGKDSKVNKNKPFADVKDLDSLPSDDDPKYLGIVWESFNENLQKWQVLENQNQTTLKGFPIDDNLLVRRILQNKLTKNCYDTSNTVKIEFVIPAINESDSLLLVEIFEKLDGKNWKATWNFDSAVSTWKGVTVEKGRLVSLDLSNNNLTGEFPKIEKLNLLRYLNLSNNNLSGEIPSSIGIFTTLEYLDLSQNNFSGKLPKEMRNLEKLSTLFLSHNNFKELSGSIGLLKNLRTLFVNENNLEFLPDSLALLSELLTLNVGKNELESLPENLEKLTKLESFYVDNNRLSNLPKGLSKLLNLRIFHVFNNNLSDLPDLSKMEFLEKVNVYGNALDFGDLENLLLLNGGRGTFSVDYTPQARLSKDLDTLVLTDSKIRLAVKVDGKNNLYQWYKNNEPLNTLSAQSPVLEINFVSRKDAGTYHVLVKNSKILRLTLRSGDIKLSVGCASPQNFNIEADNPLAFCENTDQAPILSINLPKNLQVQWLFNKIPISGENKNTLKSSSAGFYGVQIRDSSGCVFFAKEIDIIRFPSPEVIISSQNDKITAQTKGKIIKYEWFFNNVLIENANENSLNIENSGQYFVKVYSENNCVAQSNLLLSKVTATEQERLANQTRIYPNPAQNKFFVETENLNISQINIYNNLGQKVGIFFVKNTKLIELSLENYSQGLYLLEILSNEGRFAKSLLKE